VTRSEWDDLMRDLPAAERAALLRKAPETFLMLGEDNGLIHLGAEAEIAREKASGRTIEYLAAKVRAVGRMTRNLRRLAAAAPKRKAVAGGRDYQAATGETVFLAAHDPDPDVVVTDERPDDPPAADPEGDEYYGAAMEEMAAAVDRGEQIAFHEAARRVYAKKGDRS
jgi:hypothetical protein